MNHHKPTSCDHRERASAFKRLLLLLVSGLLLVIQSQAVTPAGSGKASADPPLLPGSITTTVQTINYGADAAPLTSVAPATGGSGNITYLWQISADNSTWTNIMGAISPEYAPPGVFQNLYFRRSAQSNGGAPVFTNSVRVLVYPQLLPGSITTIAQTISYGADAATLESVTPGSGGNGTITYLWQISTDNSTWTNISGATDVSYQPRSLQTTTYYRRSATSNGLGVFSNSIKVTVTPPTGGGDPCTPASTTPVLVTAPMTGTPASGEYYSPTSIKLDTGFSFTATTKCDNFHAYVLSPDCQPLANNFSQGQNYIVTSTPRKAMPTFSISGLTSCDVMQAVQYIDGLGRPLQTVQVKGSPSNKDVVQPIAYDQFGREAQKYLSYAATTADGSYKADALTTGINSFYNPAGNGTSGSQQGNGIVVIPQPFAQTVFESSPLNRVVEQGAAGTPWQPVAGNATGHTMKMVYATNNLNAFSGADTSVSMRAMLYNATVNSDQSRTLTIGNTAGNYYLAGQLSVTVSKDENWKDTGLGNSRGGTTETYTDKEDHVVLKRTFNYTAGALQMLSTYYVYDDLGNLAFVLPPLSGADNGITSAANQTVLDNVCYQYRYDERNRLSRKRLPGKGWEYMVYNKLNQAVLSQDAVQRTSNQWTVTKYDALGRVIMTGLWTDASALAQSDLQTNIYSAAQWDARNTSDTNTGYTISSYPAPSSYLSINYYDDYSFNNITGFPARFGIMPSGASTQTKGLLTASKTNVLGSSNMLWEVSYYDGFGRNMQTDKQHYLGGGTPNANNYDVITTGYDFTNAVTSTTRKHYNTTNTTMPVLTIANLYYYDHMGRKTQTKEQINGGTTVLLSQTDYNDIGQLKTKHLHSTNGGSTFLQNIGYAYNERGWLSQVNDPNFAPATDKLFSMALNYNTPVSAHNGSPQYNGNIAEQLYNKGTAGQKYVTYSYDQLNRLTAGNSEEAFSENGITYDANGNIQSMTRFGPNAGTLTYNYGGTNQLQSVSGGVTRSYGYDDNGNATSDGQGHTITYNLLNLPSSIPDKSLTYTYDASGQKLRKISGTTATEYIDGIQYTGTGIDFVQTEEGRVLNPTTSPNYEYTLTDHLGNNRVTFDQIKGKASEDDYYPFGLNVARGTIPSLRNHYLYNKKELQDELTQYDYGARFYDPVIARWTSVDPMAELGRRWSPYSYVMNNPIRNIDPDGMWTAIAGGVTTSDPAEIAAFFGQNDGGKKPDDPKKKDHQGDHPVPDEFKQKGLPGFPGSQRLKKKKNARETWDLGGTIPLPELKKPEKDRKKIPKGWTGEWDRQHGEVEVYDKQGNHQGAWDPESGEENEGKQRDDRKPTYNKFSSEEPDAQTMPVAGPPAGGVSPGLVQKIQTATGLTGAALWLYIIFSEGSRLYPPRNLVPIP